MESVFPLKVKYVLVSLIVSGVKLYNLKIMLKFKLGYMFHFFLSLFAQYQISKGYYQQKSDRTSLYLTVYMR